eukprot:UN14416
MILSYGTAKSLREMIVGTCEKKKQKPDFLKALGKFPRELRKKLTKFVG